MDAVGHILAAREQDPFPWGVGASLALLLHLGVAAAFIIGLGRPNRYLATRTVAVRLVQAGTLKGGTEVSVPAPPEPEKPKITKPVEEAPPPPTEKAKILPSTEKKKPPAPAPALQKPSARSTVPAAPSSDNTRGAGGTAGAGGDVSVGGATFDQPDFNYSYYIERMAQAINVNWFKPVMTISTAPLVHFRIARDGTISDAEVTRSSGLPFVDRAALRAVLASSPLPPLPSDWSGAFVGVSVVFE